ncbi:MAG: helix-turn-helix domain-containing protein, partial [Treponema sp.]|nr:helix-turn-helix domain-containing protein [Treponema sp.]
MTEIKDRLKLIRKHFKMSIREFSKQIYFTHGVYGQVEIGQRDPNERIIQLICSKFKVNKDWILTGNGDMFSENPP